LTNEDFSLLRRDPDGQKAAEYKSQRRNTVVQANISGVEIKNDQSEMIVHRPINEEDSSPTEFGFTTSGRSVFTRTLIIFRLVDKK
jgi:hypothetical protein